MTDPQILSLAAYYAPILMGGDDPYRFVFTRESLCAFVRALPTGAQPTDAMCPNCGRQHSHNLGVSASRLCAGCDHIWRA